MVWAPRDRAPTSISIWGIWSLRASTELSVYPWLKSINENPSCSPGLQVAPIIPSPRPHCYLFFHTSAAMSPFCSLPYLVFMAWKVLPVDSHILTSHHPGHIRNVTSSERTSQATTPKTSILPTTTTLLTIIWSIIVCFLFFVLLHSH